MKKIFGLSVFLLLCALSSWSQQMLVLENARSATTKKYYIGDKIAIRTKDSKMWYKGKIEDIRMHENLLITSNASITLDQITHFRTYDRRQWSAPIGTSLSTFGVGWGVFSLGGTLAGEPADLRTTAYVVGTSVISGMLIRYLFRHKTYSLQGRHRLRLLDLRI